MFCPVSYARFEREKLDKDDTEIDSDMLAQMDDDFTQESQQQQCSTSSACDNSADYTNIDTQDLLANNPIDGAGKSIFQFSGFKDEVLPA